MQPSPQPRNESKAIEIAQRLHDGTPIDLRMAQRASMEWLTQDLVESLIEDEWGDMSAEAELERFALTLHEVLVGAMVEVGYSDDDDEIERAVSEHLDEVMKDSDSIVADAQDRLADEDMTYSRRRAGLSDEL